MPHRLNNIEMHHTAVFTDIKLFGVTAFLWLIAHFHLPSSSEVANWMASGAGLATILSIAHTKFSKKHRK